MAGEESVLRDVVSTDLITGGVNIFGVLLQVILFGGLTIGLFVLIWWVLSFKVMAIVEERHAHGTFVYTKRAKLQKKRGKGNENDVERLKIMGVKQFIMPPSHHEQVEGGWVEEREQQKRRLTFESLYGITKKGRKAVRLLKQGDDYTVIPFYNEDVKYYLQVSRSVRKQWSNNIYKEGLELFKDEQTFFQKYGGVIAMSVAFFVIGMIFFFLFRQFDNLTIFAESLNQNSASIKEYAEGMTELARAMRETGGVQPIN